jgi:hypothetical protein
MRPTTPTHGRRGEGAGDDETTPPTPPPLRPPTCYNCRARLDGWMARAADVDGRQERAWMSGRRGQVKRTAMLGEQHGWCEQHG